MNTPVHSFTDGAPLLATDELYLTRSPYAVGDDRRGSLSAALTFIATSQTTMLNLTGAAFTIVGGNANETTNGTNLIAAYTAAKLTTPHGLALSATNRYTIFLLPGRFTVTTGAFVLDAQFIDIIGLGADPADVRVMSGGKTVSQTADDVLLENFLIHTTLGTANSTSTGDTAYYPNTGLVSQKCVRMVFTGVGNARAMRLGLAYSGTFIDCYCLTDGGFGGNASDSAAIAAGSFIRCKAGINSFGGGLQNGTNATASGSFYYCETAGGNSFGGSGVVAFGVASGTFVGCRSGFDVFTPYGTIAAAPGNSFGVNTASGMFIFCDSNGSGFCVTGTASGTFLFCKSLGDSFGGGGSTVSGTFKFCTASTGSFGGVGAAVTGVFEYCTASNGSFGSGSASVNTAGTFRYCNAGTNSFAGSSGTGGLASGNYLYCNAGTNSFGGGVSAGGTASGAFIFCSGGAGSFAGSSSGDGGIASGQFRYCFGVSTGSEKMFGGGAGNGGTASGIFEYCSGQDHSFAGSATATGGTANGTFKNCNALERTFAGGVTGGTFSGTAINCFGSNDCFASGSTTAGTMSGVMVNCRTTGRLNATVTGRLDGCRVEATGANQDAIKIASTPKIYNCTLIATGTGVSINAAAAANAIIAHCRTNKGMHANVTNLVTTPYNVDDADIA